MFYFTGVPKAKRGEIWRFLAKQHDFHSPPEEDQFWRGKSYEEIKEGVSCHQHSIFIDLGKYTHSFLVQANPCELCLLLLQVSS